MRLAGAVVWVPARVFAGRFASAVAAVPGLQRIPVVSPCLGGVRVSLLVVLSPLLLAMAAVLTAVFLV